MADDKVLQRSKNYSEDHKQTTKKDYVAAETAKREQKQKSPKK